MKIKPLFLPGELIQYSPTLHNKYDDTRIIRIRKIKKILFKIKPVDTY